MDAPFLELDEELWSPDGTRFTLVFDPGRIKRGLKPREEAGPILEAGKSYQWSSIATGSTPRVTRSRQGFARPFRSDQPTNLRLTRRPGLSTCRRPARAIRWSSDFPSRWTGPFSNA